MKDADVHVTRMSSKGQVVIPEQLRKALDLDSGSVFIAYGGSDAILLKRMRFSDPAAEFQKMARWGTARAKKLGIDTSPQAIVRAQHKRRAKD